MGLIAFLVVIAGLLATLGHAGYLAMLNSVANKRAGGAPVAQYVRSRFPIAGGPVGGALLALPDSGGNQRAGGAPVPQYVPSRFPIARGTVAGAAPALLLSGGTGFADVPGNLPAGGSGGTALKALESTQKRYRTGE